MDPLADFAGLTDVALRRRREPAHGLFVAEGAKVAARALAAGYRPRTLAVTHARCDRPDVAELVDLFARAEGAIRVVSEEQLSQKAGFHVHRGVLASFERRPLPTVGQVVAEACTLVVLEAVVDHTNVGAVFRSAAALGADGLVLDPRCADPLYRRAIRTSMGTVFAMPYARCASWPTGLTQIRSDGFRVLALTPSSSATDLSGLRVGPQERIALLLGSEGSGLSPAAATASDTLVRIPMDAGVDSLNVASCAALALWAVRRGRGVSAAAAPSRSAALPARRAGGSPC